MDIIERKLTQFWQDALNSQMEKHFPNIIATETLVSAWKVDGWNDGTSTLHGVYQFGVRYTMCVFADYEEPKKKRVTPIFEHTGWDSTSG